MNPFDAIFQIPLRRVRALGQARGDSPNAALAGLMLPTIAMVFTQSTVSVALPALRAQFALRADAAAWLVTAYMLPYMIFMPLYGRLGDGLGRRRLIYVGLVIFGMGTLLCLTAPTLPLLIAGRCIQGVGASGLMPLAMAVVSDLFPGVQRGRALGTWNSAGPAAAIVGPLFAGALLMDFGWRIIFVPSVCFTLLALVLIPRVVPAGRSLQPRLLRQFDWVGVVLLGSALITGVFYLSSQPITGVPPLRDWRLLGAALGLALLFGWWERRRLTPFIDFGILRNGNFRWASVAAALRMVALGSVGFLAPLYLAEVRGLSAPPIGLIMTLHAAMLLVTMRVGGQLADRVGSSWPVTLGTGGQGLALVVLALLSPVAPLWLAVAVLMSHGLAAGLSLAALHRAALGDVPIERVGAAAGLYSMVRFSGSVVGSALVGVLLQSGLERAALESTLDEGVAASFAVVDAYRFVFVCIAFAAALGVAIGIRLHNDPLALADEE